MPASFAAQTFFASAVRAMRVTKTVTATVATWPTP